MYASGNGHIDIVKLLIEADAYVNTKDNYGGTALMLALEEGQPEIAKLLKEAGADANAKRELQKAPRE